MHSVRPFGVFVELPGYRRHGMVHHSQVADEIMLGREEPDEDKVRALEWAAAPGTEVHIALNQTSALGHK